jgi:DNA polymerase III subunit alpha
MMNFTHLHVHSEYSVLDGLAKTNALINIAKEDGMEALALTDHGVMFGIKEFHNNCKKAGIKPIIGCEIYVARKGATNQSDKEDRAGYHLILLAKNHTGYNNLLKLITYANTEGFYYKPRIDHDLLEKHHEGLIVTSACLGGEIPQLIMKNRLDEASERIEWFKQIFGDDYYLEIMRHKTNDPRMKREVYDHQVAVNEKIIELSIKHQVKVIASNDVHFAKEDDAEAHDLLICLMTGKYKDEENRLHYTKQEWLKTRSEMSELFSDFPEALENTMEIAEKVEFFELNSAPIMPVFEIPEEFGTKESYRENLSESMLIEEFLSNNYNRLGGYETVLRIKLEADYLKHIVFEGAKKRYGDALTNNPTIQERIDFELNTIKTMGFPGYFLITQDFINYAKQSGVIVGPGRGSAAGSVVAYCTGITNIDPLKYDLLFERFLNPDRISMPDIDVDFDDDGREQVLEYVRSKYGADKVAHICTFGTMASKLAIRDVARVLRLPLNEADRLAKMVPEAPKMTFDKAFRESPELKNELENGSPLVKETLHYAQKIEGTVRQTGTHACGILIGRENLVNNIPLMRIKDAEMLVTQYDGDHVEPIGLLKMDFLGLKTLSIIKTTLDNIRHSKGMDIDIDEIPMDDEKTYQLFTSGLTTGIFQFESDGMKKHLKALRPNEFDDLVAMNALYRPGPMEYIPNYIERKHGKEAVKYDHPIMEKYLKDTYGITVFQEQVMLLSRALAGFTRGESDTLRKVMGKKKVDLLPELKKKFHEGCLKNPEFIEGCKQVKDTPEKLIEKIWKDWEAFASYAFNKSHSVCYANLAYITGYLKANYPSEFMAAVMSRNLNDIKKISGFMEECRRMGINVFGPSVQESFSLFTVDKNDNIRFGLSAIKGVGSNAVREIIEKREAEGEFSDIFDFISRVSTGQVNKKSMESLIYAGGFDCFDRPKRHEFFCEDGQGVTFLETLSRYGAQKQSEENGGNSLFGDMLDAVVQTPKIPDCPAWSSLQTMKKEKEHIGMYLTAHPLDEFQFELKQINTLPISKLNMDAKQLLNKDFMFAGLVTDCYEKRTASNTLYGGISIEDYTDSYDLRLFSKDYMTFKNYMQKDYLLLIRARMEYWEKSNSYNLRVKEISELSTLKDSYFKSINLNLSASDISAQFIQEFVEILDKEKGNIQMNISLFQPVTGSRVDLFSRKYRIKLTKEFIHFIENNPAIHGFTLK